jgi:hypothetical protein
MTETGSGDLEIVISGVASAAEGQSERHRLEAPVRYKMLVQHAPADGAEYHVGNVPLTKDEFALALEMAKVRQLDRIADLLERAVVQMEERRK